MMCYCCVDCEACMILSSICHFGSFPCVSQLGSPLNQSIWSRHVQQAYLLDIELTIESTMSLFVILLDCDDMWIKFRSLSTWLAHGYEIWFFCSCVAAAVHWGIHVWMDFDKFISPVCRQIQMIFFEMEDDFSFWFERDELPVLLPCMLVGRLVSIGEMST